MLRIIVLTSYAFSVLSFLLFLYLATRRPAPAPDAGGQADMPELSDVTRLLEALAKLTDSFAKAGPTVMSLVAAIFFLLIAVLGAGFGQLSGAA